MAGVGTGSHSSWRRGSLHPQMSMSPSADREQAAAPPMRPWVRRSSRTCPRPHRTPVSHSGRGHRSDQDGVPSCCCYPPLAGIMKSAARLTPPPPAPCPPRHAAVVPSYRRTRTAARSSAAPKVPRRSAACARARSWCCGSAWCLPRARRPRATCACFTDPPHMMRKPLGASAGSAIDQPESCADDPVRTPWWPLL